MVLWVTFLATVGPAEARSGYLSLIVAFFLVATSGHRWAAWTVIVVGYVGSLWLAPLVWGQSLASLDSALNLGGWLAVLVVAAEVVRMRRERVAETRATRKVEERRRASEERLLMARDLHDVIGHNISMINVQAAVGLDLIDSQPEQARAALAAIKTVSKDALGELRGMLAALRQDGDEAPRSPAPGLDQLGELIALTQAVGLHVALETTGLQVALPAAADLTAYRIVQEALTNITRHAPGATVTIRIGYRPDAVLVEIVDTGCPDLTAVSPANGAISVGNGTGIDGMRQRAAALGGGLEAGPRPEGGFRVAAWLPVEVRG
jgi:signal transduction histidine kinase